MQRLGALGTLAGGIAHDFNNFLTVILGNISLARMMLDPGSGLQEILAESERAATNASSLTQQLLTFTTDGEPVRMELGVAELLEEALRGTLDSGRIVPDLRVGEDVPHVSVDPAQIVLALRNLIENAAQAMPSGGTITIRASRSPDRANGRDADDPPGFVRIEIEDEGPGIPEEILPRVFDPFFSTRESAQGLGLTTAFSIVSKHGGRIRAENLPGGGCRFTLLLPTAEGIAEAPECAPEAPESGVGDVGRSGGRILVMDDKAMIRRSAEAMLDYLGYRVQTAADGAEAVRLYREAIEEEDRFDAVLLDLTVPGGMNGRETLAELRRIDPSVRAAISSGYPNDPAMVEHGRLGFRAAVIKPYSLLKLAAALREITAD